MKWCEKRGKPAIVQAFLVSQLGIKKMLQKHAQLQEFIDFGDAMT